MNLKDILIGILVAYVVMDVLISMLAKRSYPSLIEKMLGGLDQENVMMACVIGVLAGVLAWYLAKNSKELFKPLEVQEETVVDEGNVRDS